MKPVFVQTINGKEYGYAKFIPIRKNKGQYVINVRCTNRESKKQIACSASAVITTSNSGNGYFLSLSHRSYFVYLIFLIINYFQ